MGFRTRTINFEEVVVKDTIKKKCREGCGRTVQETEKFTQTINPFNKNKDGQVKTHGEIMDELIPRLNNWKKEARLTGLICNKCWELQKEEGLCTEN